MAGKRAKKNQQVYGIPFPLPFLQTLHQQQQQQKRKHPSSQSNQSKTAGCHARVSLWELWHAVSRFVRTYTVHSDSASPQLGLIEVEFHPEGESVWVKGQKDMMILFQQGFFGKGTLSRSEATWKQRTSENTQDTSLEGVTRQRRIERNILKETKAQQQQQQQQSSQSLDSSATSTPIIQSQASAPVVSSTPMIPSLTPNASNSVPSSLSESTEISHLVNYTKSQSGDLQQEDVDYEHLQLSLEEAFFLVFAIDVIAIKDIETAVDPKKKKSQFMSIQDCWIRFSESVISKARQKYIINNTQPEPRRHLCDPLDPSIQPSTEISPNNPFIVRYVAYHYFRSQGWVVKDGLKFGSDFMLYKRGMVFGHSRYSVRVVTDVDERDNALVHPNAGYQNFFSPTPGILATHGVLSWHWLLGLNRVIAQVQKTVILCHVVLPTTASSKELRHPHTAIPLYSV
ncbi:tRNA splicing endonuclease subunit sen2, partial [Lunasporangiospora selenospora]